MILFIIVFKVIILVFIIIIVILGVYHGLNIYKQQQPYDFKNSNQQYISLESLNLIDQATGSHWTKRLYTPTYMAKLDDKWFIVDCWHHRILWSYDPYLRIQFWNILDENLAGPHSIAFDGNVFAVDNTGEHAVNLYEFKNESFKKIKVFNNLGKRPHRVIYDDKNNSFYAISANSQDIFVISNINGEYNLKYSKNLKHLTENYIRSLVLIQNKFYFISQGELIETTNDDNFSLIRKIKVPEEFEDLNDLYFDGSKYILTSKDAIGISSNIDGLRYVKNIKENLGIKGFPYFVSEFSPGVLIIPEIRSYSALNTYYSKNLTKKEQLHDYGLPNKSSAERYLSRPL